MIKLKNIKTTGNVIECDIYPEDSKESGVLVVNTLNGKIVKSIMPPGYEWCRNHLEHARMYLAEHLNEINKQKVTEKVLMWY